MTVLDATKISSEDQIGQEPEQQEQPGQSEQAQETPQEATVAGSPIRTVTIPMPDTCLTKVELLLRQVTEDSKALWIPGFRVTRSYNPEPFERILEELPLPENDGERYESLGTAVAYAADAANWSLGDNSDKEDQYSIESYYAIQEWLEEFVKETATEAIFDDATDAERNQEADSPAPDDDATQPAADDQPAIQEQPAAVAATQEAPQSSPSVSVAPIGYTITEEAKAAYDERKRELEEEIGRLAIEEANLKAELKANRDAKNSAVEELSKHTSRGPEKMPLFDRAPETRTASVPLVADLSAAATPAPPAADTSDAPDASIDECPHGGPHELSDEGDCCRKCFEPMGQQQPPSDAAAEPGNEPWRSKKMADLDGITEKIAEILDGHNIRTLGDWVDWPGKNPGLEYTQLKGVTEKRYEKIMDAVTKATT